MSSRNQHNGDLDPILRYAPPRARAQGRWPPESAAPPVDRLPPSQPAISAEFSDDGAIVEMRQRLALEPEWVPAPQDAAPVRDLWTLALPASGVLGVAALLAWVVVSVPSVTHVVRAAFPGMLASTDSQTSVPPSGVTAAASVASSSGVEKAAPEPPNRTVAAAEPLEELTDPREQPLPAPSAGAANIETLADQQTSPAEQAPPAPAHEVTMAERRSAPDFVVTRQLDRDELASMLRRADDFIKSGDLSSARLLLQRAAEAGSVQAALTLAGTFDPNVLAALGFQDSAADIAMARVWYEHAEQFGSSEAPRRLRQLANNALK